VHPEKKKKTLQERLSQPAKLAIVTIMFYFSATYHSFNKHGVFVRYCCVLHTIKLTILFCELLVLFYLKNT